MSKLVEAPKLRVDWESLEQIKDKKSLHHMEDTHVLFYAQKNPDESTIHTKESKRIEDKEKRELSKTPNK